MRVFITGATGFLGYHLTRACIAKGCEVVCLRRSSSRSPFDAETEKHVRWITYQDSSWKEELRNAEPDVLLHAAWGGVAAAGRGDAAVQQDNVSLTREILYAYPFRQRVLLGSQDEYGLIGDTVDEHHPLKPLSDYGKAKIECCQLLQDCSCQYDSEWQWIRIFSVYGEGQRDNWLIPSVITRCLSGEKVMETTPGEQVYSYLYAPDFARAVVSVLGQKGKSGIYNLSSGNAIALKDLFLLIKRLTAVDIEFRPSLPYRKNQSMMILGNTRKFIRSFGPFENTPLEAGLRCVIDTMKRRKENICSNKNG